MSACIAIDHINYGGITWGINLDINASTAHKEYSGSSYVFNNKASGASVTFDTESELQAFKTLYTNITSTFHKRIKLKTKYDCLHFCFAGHHCPVGDNPQTFDDLARICATNPDVLRLRLSYEFYLSHAVFNLAKMNLTCHLPYVIEREILHRTKSFLAIKVAHYVYQNPSTIDAYILGTFSDYASKNNILDAIQSLLIAKFIGQKDRYYYFIGKM